MGLIYCLSIQYSRHTLQENYHKQVMA